MSVRVLALVGSLRAGSYNRRLAEAAVRHAPEGVEVVIYEGLGDVPFYNQDIDAPAVEPGAVPAAARRLRAEAARADVLLLVTPEYNGTIPAVVKNAIDWLSRPYGASAIKGKPIAVIGTSVSGYGAKWAHDDARRSAEIAGGAVMEGVSLSVPNAGRFEQVHPADDADLARQLSSVLNEVAQAAG